MTDEERIKSIKKFCGNIPLSVEGQHCLWLIKRVEELEGLLLEERRWSNKKQRQLTEFHYTLVQRGPTVLRAVRESDPVIFPEPITLAKLLDDVKELEAQNKKLGVVVEAAGVVCRCHAVYYCLEDWRPLENALANLKEG